MLRLQNWITVFIITIISGQVLGQEEAVIGYYQSWQWREAPSTLDPRNIPYEKLTAINYSFFYPTVTGEIVGMDPAADRYLLLGKTDSLSAGGESGSSIVELARSHGTQVILSIGGWDHSGNFPQISADPEKRANFAHACVKHIRHYGFDGIDIDWEFPGYVRHNGTPQDRENFTLLLQTVRDSLDALGEASGTRYLMSASLPAAASHLPDMEVTKVAAILDYLNIMTYDLFGSWGPISNHNSALYGPAQGDSARCLDGAFQLYHVENGIDAEKINLGAAFYGHSYTQCSEIYGKHAGADTSLFPRTETLLYNQIAERIDLFERFWDEKAQAPYLVSKSHQVLISLDDEESVARKADYIVRNNARGLIIWPLMGDRLKDGRTPLLDVIYRKFNP